MMNNNTKLFFVGLRNILLLLSIVVVVVPTTTVASTTGSPSTIERSWKLYHKINDEYKIRNIITLKVVDPTVTSTATSTSKNDPKILQINITNPTNDNDSSSSIVVLDEITAQSIVQSSYYQLKLVPEHDANEVNSIIASVPACNIRRANYRDEIIITLGPYGDALSFQYIPKISPLAPLDCSGYTSALPTNNFNSTNFISTISYDIGAVGMTLNTVLQGYKAPPGLKRIPGSISHRGVAGSGGGSSKGVFADEDILDPNGKQQNAKPGGFFGFFGKYWYIIVPLMIVNMMSGGAAPPQEGGAEGSGQQQQQQQVAGNGGASGTPRNTPQVQAVPAASSGGGSPTKQRRGKRG